VVVAVAVLAVIALALAFQLQRTRARLEAVTGDLGEAIAARDAAGAARREAEADAASARRERDDALEREKRAKREAAEVSRRMKDEAERRAGAEAALADAEAEQARLGDALADAEAASSGGDEDRDARLWSLALAAVRHTWEVSVAPSPEMASPLDDADDELRAAVTIEVDAAREEAGAAVELEWHGDAVAPPSVALGALSITQALLARLAKVSDESLLRVTSTPEGVTIEVSATDADGRSVVPDDVAVDQQVAPGRWELS
jgi:autotransporter adhesin